MSNFIPAPKSIELHLGTSPEFSRYSKKVKALGGRYSECRGDVPSRYVHLPWTEEGRALANTLVAQFGRGKSNCNRGTTLIARGVDSFRGRHIHAPVVVQHVDKDEADPCGAFLAKYETAFLQAFPDAVNPEPVVEPKPPVLRATLHLEGSTQFWAVLEALQQFIDNGNDADDISEELEAKLEAAEAFRDQLEVTLASLAG